MRNSNGKRNDALQPVYALFVGHQGRGDYKIARKQRCEDFAVMPLPAAPARYTMGGRPHPILLPRGLRPMAAGHAR
ncbi:MAG TPA: hypothetical protein VKZ76_01855 [Edaphocola sp.]|nr:hypothetical protein [Edaphocola sp.]